MGKKSSFWAFFEKLYKINKNKVHHFFFSTFNANRLNDIKYDDYQVQSTSILQNPVLVLLIIFIFDGFDIRILFSFV